MVNLTRSFALTVAGLHPRETYSEMPYQAPVEQSLGVDSNGVV